MRLLNANALQDDESDHANDFEFRDHGESVSFTPCNPLAALWLFNTVRGGCHLNDAICVERRWMDPIRQAMLNAEFIVGLPLHFFH